MKALNHQILIVDDQPTNLKILFNFLQEEGFQVLIAKNGESALKKLEKIVPELILLDVMMPGMDGFETCRKLKQLPKAQNIPIIFMTALADKMDKVKGLNAGAVDYVTKPLIKEEVLARINIHIQLRQITQQLQEKNECLQQEICDRQRAEQQLQYRLSVESALAQVSKELATNEAADLNRVLEILGLAVGVNHAYLTRFHNHSSISTMTHEWCDSHTLPQIKLVQNIDTSAFPWWLQKYRNNENVVINDLDAMPMEAETEKNLLKLLSIRSVLAVPIHNTAGEPWGTIGFETNGDNYKTWSDEDVKLLRVVGEMIYTYSARKQAREALSASQALYAGIVNHSVESIFLVNVLSLSEAENRHRFVYQTINPAYEKALGISAATIANQTPLDVFSLPVALHLIERYQACLDAGVSMTYEETLPLPGGTRIWRTILVPIQDTSGTIVQIQGSSRDITEAKQAEAEKQRQTQYRQLLTSVMLKIRASLHIEEILQTTVTEVQNTLNADRVLFFRLGSEGGGKIVSEAAVPGCPTLLGSVIEEQCLPAEFFKKYQAGEIKFYSDLQGDECTPCYLEFMEQYHIKSNLIVPILVSGTFTSAEKFAESFSEKNSSDLLWGSGSHAAQHQLWGLLCVQQCHESRQWESLEIELLQQLAHQLSIALQQAQLLENETRYVQELARSNAELEQFAYVASHDLQAPLATLSGYAELLEQRYQDQLDEKAFKYIRNIVKSSTRMQTMIDDLLKYSRVGKNQKEFESCDCNHIVEEACDNLQFAIRKSQAVIQKDHLPVVMGDGLQLVQLFQNLISNAIKYRRPDVEPRIQIQAQLQGEKWVFSIHDNGIGIDLKYRDRIFQIFQRLHAQEHYSGTGIGLAICQKIVELHGGQIWVESTLQSGSSFYFTLPKPLESQR